MRFVSFLIAMCLGCLALGQFNTQTLPVARWSTFQGGTYSQIKNFETRVISTEGAWQTYWRTLTGNSPATAPKGIDWAREELWVVAAGERRTGGSSLYIRSVQHVDARNVQVEYVMTTSQGGMSTQAVTSPYAVIRVERTGGVPKFVRCDDSQLFPGGSTVLLPSYYEDTVRPLRWNLLERGSQSNVGREGTFALASRNEFSRYLESAFPRDEEMAKLESRVRWHSDMILAIHTGSRNRPTSIEIETATVDQYGRVMITWFEREARSDNPQRCQPYLLMSFPRTSTQPVVRKVYGN